MSWNFTYIIVIYFGNVIVLSLLISVLSSFKNSHKKALSLLALITLSLIVALRDKKVAIDTPKYIELFVKYETSFFYKEGVYEPLYIFLNKTLRLFTENYHILMFIITFAHIYLIFKLYEKLSKRFYPLLLSMYISTFVFWLSNLSMLRQGLAIPIVAFSIYYLVIENNRKMFILLSTLAGTIHFSSIPLSILIFGFVTIYKKLNVKTLRKLTLISVTLILYPKNIFIDFILKIITILSKYIYSSATINKIVWYFTWNKLAIWHVKHVYFLILLLFIVVALTEKNKKNLIITLLPASILALIKYDEMVTDRLFMYFIPFIPYITLTSAFKIKIKNKNLALTLLLIATGVIVWFNIKFLLLQYPGWFIYPYKSVR